MAGHDWCECAFCDHGSQACSECGYAPEDARLRLLAWVLPAGSVVLGIVAGVVFCATVLMPNHRADQPVCHAVTEDSVITDCDYRDGGWHQDD